MMRMPLSPSAEWAISRSAMLTRRARWRAWSPRRARPAGRGPGRGPRPGPRASHPRRQVAPGRAGPLERVEQRRRGRRRPRCRARPQRRDEVVEHGRRSRRGSRRRCRARSPGGPPRCGSCRGSRRRPGAAGRRAPRRARSARPISVAAVRWGTWLTTGDERVVAVGRQRHHLGAERGHDRPQRG